MPRAVAPLAISPSPSSPDLLSIVTPDETASCRAALSCAAVSGCGVWISQPYGISGRCSRRTACVVLPALCCSVLLTAGCGPGGGQGGRTAAPLPGCQEIVRGFSCQMQERIEAARSYLAKAPGRAGLVLHDRVTGATWRNENARQSFPAASTVKLAMVADLLVREQQGSVRLTPADRPLIDAALRESADEAADRLWYAYENTGFLGRIRAFGMTGASFTSHAYWGAMTCSADDLSNLMDYVLNRLPARDRNAIVEDLRNVSPVQHWGVWGAGPRNQPGAKNGWVSISGIWTVSTVGFAGQHARYTLAIMDHLGGEAGFQEGANTLTQVAAILLQGHQIPAPDVSATP
jgi:hypothetical protein